MIGWAPPLPGGLQDDPQLSTNAWLADELVEPLGSQRALDDSVIAIGMGVDQSVRIAVAPRRVRAEGHARSKERSAARSRAGTSGSPPAAARCATDAIAPSASRRDQPRDSSPDLTGSSQPSATG